MGRIVVCYSEFVGVVVSFALHCDGHTAKRLTSMLSSADIEVPEEKKAAVEKDLKEAGISLDGQGEMGGWGGGEVWLVATYKEIEDWEPVAKRKLPA